MKLLIDGDILVYRGGFAAERTSYLLFPKGDEEMGYVASFRYKKEVNEWIKFWGHSEDDFTIEKWRQVEPLSFALSNVKHMINNIMRGMGSNDIQIYITADNDSNFRNKIAVTHKYKGNRPKDGKPEWYKEIRSYLVREWDCIVVEGMEADDAMGIAQYEDKTMCVEYGFIYKEQAETCIVTIDKDLDNTPGWHYNFVKHKKYWVTEEEAIKSFYLQLLTGDRTDNIIGLKGIGPKTAEKILAECETEFDMYYEVAMKYKEKDLPYERLVENANLLWIRREEGVGWNKPRL